MKVIIAILALSFFAPAAAGQHRDLQLTLAIIEQESCVNGPQTDLLKLALRLRYTNVGKQKLILYRGNRIFYQAFVSRADATSPRSLEFRTSHAGYLDSQPEKIDTSTPGSAFITLSPGAAYETRQSVAIPVAAQGAGRVNVNIAAGEHLLSMTVSTWYESRKLAEGLRARWRERGFLLSEPLSSSAVRFVVGTGRASVACR